MLEILDAGFTKSVTTFFENQWVVRFSVFLIADFTLDRVGGAEISYLLFCIVSTRMELYFEPKINFIS